MADGKLGFTEFADKIREHVLDVIRADLRLNGKLGEFPIRDVGFISVEEGVYCGLYVGYTWIKVKVYKIPCIYDHRNNRLQDGYMIRITDFAAGECCFRDFSGNSTTVEQVLMDFPKTIKI